MGNSRNKARSLLLRLKKRNPDLWKLIKLLFAFLSKAGEVIRRTAPKESALTKHLGT